MKIDLSPDEYRDLLDILHVAEVVMFGHRKNEDERTGRHRGLIQKLYSLAREGGLERFIGLKESVKTFVPTADFEEHSPAHDLINEFGDHLFWDQLIARLSVRDAALIAGGIDRLNAMSDSERQITEGAIRQRYIEEFSRNGVANLEIVERLRNGGGIPVKTSD